jgi:hypothetical protein
MLSHRARGDRLGFPPEKHSGADSSADRTADYSAESDQYPKWSQLNVRQTFRTIRSAGALFSGRMGDYPMGLGIELGESYRSTPSILLFADSPAGLADQEHAIHQLEGRIAASGPIATAIAQLDEACDVGAVVVDASEDAPELDQLLDRLDAAAREGHFRSVLRVTPDLIDLAAARCPHPHVAILCGGDAAEGITALALALVAAGRVPQFAGEHGPMRLKQLSEEVGRIARTLAALSESVECAPLRPAPRIAPADIAEPTAAMIRANIRARRMREQFFAAEFFADPAWDMLLDLMAARIEGGKVAVSSLCIASAVPATTGLRWIKTLTDEGLFVRVADPHDGRRVFIELSAPAAQGVSAYFRALGRAGLASH